MPTYEYICQSCNHELEAVQGFDEPSLTICPACGGNLRKKFGSVGVVFKGSGFYRTDSRQEGNKKTESTDKAKTESKSKETSAKKGESGAPAEKKTTKPVEKPSKTSK